jgi:hypothetical protein
VSSDYLKIVRVAELIIFSGNAAFRWSAQVCEMQNCRGLYILRIKVVHDFSEEKCDVFFSPLYQKHEFL